MKGISVIDNSVNSILDLMYKQRWNIILLLSAILIIPYLYASFFVHPFGDDLILSHRLEEKGRVDFVIDFFLSWSGRYTDSILYSIVGASPYDEIWMFKLVPVLFIIIFIISLYSLISEFLGKTFSFSKRFIISFAFASVYISFIPEPFSAFYWNCASYYTLILSFYLIFLKYLMRFYFNRGNKAVNLIALVFLNIIVCGMTEVYFFFNMVIFGAILLHRKFVRKEGFDKPALMLFALTVIILILVTKFSGNGERMTVSDRDYGFVSSAIRALYDLVLLNFVRLLGSPLLLFIILAVLLIPKKILEESKVLIELLKINPVMLFITGVFCLYLAHAISLYGAGYTIQGRLLNVTYFLFVLLVTSCFLIMLNNMGYLFDLKWGKAFIILFIFVMGSGIFSKSTLTILAESNFILPQFNKELNERYAIVKEAKKSGADKVVVTPITVNPRTFYLGEYRKEMNFYNSPKAIRELTVYFKIKVELSQPTVKYEFN